MSYHTQFAILFVVVVVVVLEMPSPRKDLKTGYTLSMSLSLRSGVFLFAPF